MPPDNPQQALRSLADGWLNYSFDSDTGRYDKTDQSTVKAGDNLIDRLAGAGGYVLPFSYDPGTKMTGTPSHPSFIVTPYTSNDVGRTDPVTTGPSVLQDELTSIHSVFQRVPIVVVGHSNGGLIAEQWWLSYGSHDAEGVVQVFALDSPLNGVAAGNVCAAGVCTGAVGPIIGAVYGALWAHQDTYDPIALKLDAKNHLFTAIADLGDPLYDAADYPATVPSGHFATGVKNIGLVSQLYWTEPSCAQSGYDLSSRACTATGRAIINPCGHNLDDGRGPIFGTPRDLWLHSLVKNCPGTIQAVLRHIASAPLPTGTTTPTTTTTAPVTSAGPTGATSAAASSTTFSADGFRYLASATTPTQVNSAGQYSAPRGSHLLLVKVTIKNLQTDRSAPWPWVVVYAQLELSPGAGCLGIGTDNPHCLMLTAPNGAGTSPQQLAPGGSETLSLVTAGLSAIDSSGGISNSTSAEVWGVALSLQTATNQTVRMVYSAPSAA
jgi:hypothetical protein